MRLLAALSLAIMLGACSPRGANQVLQLHCRGERVVDAQPATHVERAYRIDLRVPALEDWNFGTGRYVRWADGRVSRTDPAVTFVGEMQMMDKRMVVRRQVHFDRSTTKIRDQVEASWGSVMAFEGTCQER